MFGDEESSSDEEESDDSDSDEWRKCYTLHLIIFDKQNLINFLILKFNSMYYIETKSYQPQKRLLFSLGNQSLALNHFQNLLNIFK